MLIILIWRNLWRNRNRTLITMASVFFAVLLSVITDSLQTGAFDNLIKNVVGFYSGYVQIHAKGYWEEQLLENSFVYNDSLDKRIKKNTNINIVAPRLESYVLASSDNNTSGCLLVGILPDTEKQLIELHNKLIKGTYPDLHDRKVYLGEGLAKKLQLNLNDTIILLGQGYHGTNAAGKYPIGGILHFGSPDLNNKVLFMPLPEAQQLLGAEGRATTLALGLKNNSQLNPLKADLQSKLGKNYEVMTWEDMMPEIVEHIRLDKGTSTITAYLLYFLVSFGIFSTLLMLLAERRYEFGMLTAIGMKKRHLGIMLFTELIFINLTGCLTGVLVSLVVAFYFSINPLRFGGEMGKLFERYGFEPIFPTSTQPEIFLKQTMIIIVITVILSLYPVFRIFRLNPIDAMKK